MRIVPHVEAEQEIRAAFDYYENAAPNLGRDFSTNSKREPPISCASLKHGRASGSRARADICCGDFLLR